MQGGTLLLLILLGLIGAACSGDAKSAPTPPSSVASPQPSPAAGESATPQGSTGETVAGIAVRKWMVQAPAKLPPGAVLYVEKGCTQCDGPTESIERVRARADGSTELATVFKAPGDSQRYILSTFIASDGHELWVTVCSRGYCGGVGQVSADAQVTFHHSLDGGTSWKQEGTRAGMASITAVTAIGPLLVESALDSTSGKFTTSYTILPNGPSGAGAMPIRAPQGASSLYFPQTGMQLLWLGADNQSVLRSDGSVVFKADLGGHDSTGGVFPVGAPSADFQALVMGWTHRDSSGTRPYQAFVRDGKPRGIFTGLALNTNANPGAWLDATRAYGTVSLSPSEVPGATARANSFQSGIPVLIDFERGEITPLEIYGPLFTDAYRGRNLIRAATTSP